MTIRIALECLDDYPDTQEFKNQIMWSEATIFHNDDQVDSFEIETTRSMSLQEIFDNVLNGSVDETLSVIIEANNKAENFIISHEDLPNTLVSESLSPFVKELSSRKTLKLEM